MPEIPAFILERVRSNADVFTADEVATWPSGQLDDLVAAGVLLPEQPAKSIACDACGDDHVEVVEYVEAPPGTGLRAYIPCPVTGRVRVPLERLRQWRADPAAIRTDVRTMYVHYEAGHRVYACATDEAKQSFDFSANCFRPVNQLVRQQDACLLAEGRWDSRAEYGFSYTVTLDLYRLVAKTPDDTIPAGGMLVSLHWLIQKGDDPVLQKDKVLDSCRVRYVDGKFTPIDQCSSNMFDEHLAFARKEQWEREGCEFRSKDFDKREELATRLSIALESGHVGNALRVFAEGLAFWANGLKRHLFDHCYHDTKNPMLRPMFQSPNGPRFTMVPGWIVEQWVGMHEAYDLVEFHKGSEQARALSERLQRLVDAREEFSQQVVDVTCRCRCEFGMEESLALEEAEKDLRRHAYGLCEHLGLLASQFDAAAVKDAPIADEPISDRAQLALVAMLELEALDSDRLQSTESIAIKALGKGADPNSLKAVMSELKTRKFVVSKLGRGGGCWLTEKGRARAEKLRNQ